MRRAGAFPAAGTAVLTTHFGDPAWVELLVARLRAAFPDIPAEAIFVVDQDRTETSAARLRSRLGPVRVLAFPPSEPHVDATGHDHAHVLNLAVRELDADFVLLFDSDAHPVSPAARERLAALIADSDAVLAALGPDGTRTHPCFMLLGPAVDRDRLFFDAGQLDLGVDTGREVYGQVLRMGLRAELLRPEHAFEGHWGTFFLGRSLYHHGSGSFGSSPSPRLQRQAATWRRQEALVRRKVFRGDYGLSGGERLCLRALAWRRQAAARLSSSARRARVARPGRPPR
jgi:hypothetical protein